MGFKRYGLLILLILAASSYFLTRSPSSQTDIRNNQFYYFGLADRIATLEETWAAVESRYALLEIKRRRLGVEIEQVFAEAIAAEKKFLDTRQALEQAASNLDFLDRIKKTLARFQDSHLTSKAVTPLPEIYLGFDLQKIGKHYYLDYVSDRIAELGRRNHVSLRRGTRVLAINQQSIEAATQSLLPYISASSPRQRLAQARRYLTKRSFRYPKSSVAAVTFRLDSGKILQLKLRWKYRYAQLRLDALYYLEKNQFNHLELAPDPYDKAKSARMLLTGDSRWFGVTDPGKLIYRFGRKSVAGNEFGMLQIYSFFEQQVLGEAGDSLQDWLAPIAQFLAELEQAEIPLIIDLRQNEGGHVELPNRLLSLLAKKGDLYPSYSEAYRITPGIAQMWQRINPDRNPHTSDAIAAGLIQKSIAMNQVHSDVWSKSLPIAADVIHGAFNQKIAVWLGPECLSSCDILALLFEKNDRAVTIGKPSGGTGAGYLNWDPYLDAQWTDLRHIVKVDIPNMMFGHSDGPRFRFASGSNAVFRYNRENIPVIPVHPYEPTLDDLLEPDAQLLKKTAEYLRSQKHSSNMSNSLTQ